MHQITNEQSLSISYMKAIGIIVVVIGHYTSGFFNVMHPYLYHMPFFFFVGGLTLKNEIVTFNALRKLSKKIIPYIVFTYILTGVLAITLNKFTGLYFGEPFTTNPLEKNFHNNPLFLVCWFLLAYYLSSIISRIIISVTTEFKHQNITLIIIAIIIGFVALNICAVKFKETGYQIYNVSAQSLYGSMFMLLGFSLKKQSLTVNNPISAMILIVITGTMISFGLIKQSAMAWSTYPSGFIMTSIASLICIFVVLIISNILSSKYNRLLKMIGDNSKTIMSWHLSVFAMLNLLFLFFGFENHEHGKLNNVYNQFSFILYVFLGIIVPILPIMIKNKLKIIT
ncbi:TPA: acyltransferase family protein [Escherichia coli]|uniref:acyltransferase family protein n=3 Tax=Escherichia coli TaxID=562 RepID=UPI0012FF6363|nr:acyltransferase family protein [Escherichia coli]EKK1484542.1 acyltransferase family protein [Escherichia coli]MBI1433301.1 acyltransferase family protein [Escherichia coli]MBI1458764.1 acyltransferase family protein [Escherichia coli]HAM9540336.1 acyltransferase family protein [Escherichia coli]HAN4528594.1 acyltransferase family protein [Escherichia coli]